MKNFYKDDFFYSKIYVIILEILSATIHILHTLLRVGTDVEIISFCWCMYVIFILQHCGRNLQRLSDEC